MEKRAILVNDSKFESLILKDMLQKLDYEVEIADEFDALYSIERFTPHLVIVNYIMQETTGDKLIHLIKAGMPDIKCVLSSSSDVKFSDFTNGGVDAILHTPVSNFLLRNVLEKVGQLNVIDTVKQKKTCPKCDKSLEDFKEIAFCPFCGGSIQS